MRMNSNLKVFTAPVCGVVLALAPLTVVLASQDQPVRLAQLAGPTTPASATKSPAPSNPPPLQVNQHRQHGLTITKYRHGNQVFLMTVKPPLGPTEYWTDPDGDGQFQDGDGEDLGAPVNLPKWRLGSW